MEALRIGVLNLMHDKEATRRRFTRVLEQPGLPVKLTFFTRLPTTLVARYQRRWLRLPGPWTWN